MDDLISRQAAIASAISGRVRTLPTSEDGEDWIRTSEVRESLLNLSSAEPEPRWIPVTERLPEKDGEYLVTIPNLYGDYIVTTRGYSSNLHALDRYAFRKGESGWYEFDSEYGFIGMNDFQSPKTLAWMPLPEPYKEEKDE